MNFKTLRRNVIRKVSNNNLGHRVVFFLKNTFQRLPVPDYEFPNAVSIEVASACNLRCVHCPPQNAAFKSQAKKKGLIEMDVFFRCMDEIDSYGIRKLALHKDGEPLMHPRILEILPRVKKNVNHTLYLTTNGHFLTDEIINSIISNKVDTINFSIGAATESFYQKVRGKDFTKVIDNIERFLSVREKSEWKPRVIVQIIDLPEYEEMKEEIRLFNKYWGGRGLEIEIYKKLTWGVLEAKDEKKDRYPCLSLWNNLNINSSGEVSPCCMDWNKSLIVGDASHESIEDVWKSKALKTLRAQHIDKSENNIPLCSTCNYWSIVPEIKEYRVE